MKKSLIVLVIALVAFTGSAFAQKAVKLGHINSSELMQIMPGRDSIQTVLQAEITELENNLNTMRTELEARYNEYASKKDQMSELIRSTKEQEIRDMNTRIEKFQANAQQQMQERQQELVQPIIDRAKKAIEDVAKENGYTYIFDGEGLLYSQDSDDIMPLVKKKLGLK